VKIRFIKIEESSLLGFGTVVLTDVSEERIAPIFRVEEKV
jgi:hypothetical protein